MRTVCVFYVGKIFVKSDELVPRCTMIKTEHSTDVSVYVWSSDLIGLQHIRSVFILI